MNLLKGVFVTGTDTGVGKTFLCAAILRRYAKEMPLAYWKPIQTGTLKADDTRTVHDLAGLDGRVLLGEGLRFRAPVSPHLAARLEGRRIEGRALQDRAQRLDRSRSWIVEGAGGLLVPLNGREMMADLALSLKLPLLIVARSTLGTINHTLLTLEAARRRGLGVAGVVLIGRPNPANRKAVERYGRTPVLEEVPRLGTLSRASFRRYADRLFDRAGRLRAFLK